MTSYGLLCYNESYNLGDEIQSIAALQFLNNVDYIVDRNTGEITNINRFATNAMNIKTIYNGWFDGQYCKFPLPPNINPLFISFHINETDHSTDSTFNALEKNKIPFQSLANPDYLKQYEPIGCRDLHTLELLQKKGIKAYFSGCLTMTMKNKHRHRTDDILVVDSHILCPTLYKKIVPESIRNSAILMSQTLERLASHDEKMALAHSFLDKLSQAKCVITSRLHTYLSCLALKTPVIFIHDNLSDVRFKGLLEFGCVYTTGDKWNETVSIEELGKLRNRTKFEKLVKNLREKCTEFCKYTMDNQVGNTIINVCMNRTEHLKATLPTWVAAKPDEIIVIDWGTTDANAVQSIVNENNANNRIRLIRIDNVKKWILTVPYNLAAKLSKYDKILKVDCDTILDATFFKQHSLPKLGHKHECFYAGDWSKSRNDNEKHTNGLMYVNKTTFFSVGGYNEYIKTYGYDDCDLYGRLEKRITRKLLNLNTIQHLPHTNAERIENQTILDPDRIDLEIEKNRLISELKNWKGEFSKFAITHSHGKLLDTVSIDAATNEKIIEKSIKNRDYVNKTQKKLYIQVQNGLGNRLRALASAYIIAKECNRQLIVIWLPDEHCEAKFTDIFVKNYLFDNVKIIESKLKQIENSFLNIITDIYEKLYYEIEEADYFICEKLVYKNTNKIINDAVPNDLYIISACTLNNPHTDWYKECDFLRKLELVSELKARVDALSAQYNIVDAIGVHIRMGQPGQVYEDTSLYAPEKQESAKKWRAISNLDVFKNEIDKIIEKNPMQKFYLCADNESVYQEIENKKYSNIYFTKREKYDRSVEQIKSAAVDMYLLSRTKYMLGSNWSSYTEVAHRLAGKELKLAGVHFSSF